MSISKSWNQTQIFQHEPETVQQKVLYDLLVTVKAVPHESVIRTGQTQTYVKAEKEAWFYSKVTVSS